MKLNNYSIPSYSDSQLAPNWFAPFSVTVNGGANDTLVDMASPYWGAVNAIDRTYGAGTDIEDTSPFVNEDGSEFETTEATVAKRTTANASYLGSDQYEVTYKPKAFTDNGGRLYSIDINFKNLGGRRSLRDSLFLKFSLTQTAKAGTLTLGVRLIGTDDFGVEQSNIVVSEGLTFTSNVASVDTRVDGVDLDLNYRLILEYAYEPSAAEVGPNITLGVPGLQAVAFYDNDQTVLPGTLGTTTVLGAYRNPTGTVTEWQGTPWKSRSEVLPRPNYVSRIQFTTVTGNGTPGVAFGTEEYENNTNVIPLPKSVSTILGGGDISLNRISKRKVVLRNTHTTSGNTAVFSGVLVGVLVR